MVLAVALTALAACVPVTPNSVDLSWLSGSWRSLGPEEISEVTFGPMADTLEGGLMVGVMRVIVENKHLLLELISIERSPAEVTLLVKHFSRDLAPRESAPLRFTLTEVCDRGAVFTNSLGADGSPKSASYWLDSHGDLNVSFDGIRTPDGASAKRESRLAKVQ